MILIMIGAGIAGFTFHVLGRRLARAESEAESLWAGSTDELAAMLRAYCRAAVATDLLPAAAAPGFAGMRVRYREHNDRFSSVGELARLMASKLGSRSYPDLVRLVRHFYQLDYSLGPFPGLADGILAELERRLLENDGSRPVGRVERVSRGERCDARTMTLLRSGSYVEQPLGFVVYSPEQKIVGRAEVLAR